jgi:hypothetical protein
MDYGRKKTAIARLHPIRAAFQDWESEKNFVVAIG